MQYTRKQARKQREQKINKYSFYHTILTFNDPEKEGLEKQCRKMRKSAFSPFPTLFYILPKTNFKSYRFVVCKGFEFR